MRKIFRRLLIKHIFNRSVLTHWDLGIARLTHAFEPRDAVEQVAVKFKALSRGKVAIVAAYQNGKLDENIKAMARTLIRRGCDVVMVNNGRLSEEARKECCEAFALYHERPTGRGRDFASYRVGYLALMKALEIEQHYRAPEEIIFLNDSVLYVDQRMDAFLDDFFAMRGPWKGVTESLDPSYHVSSWFFSVSKEVWSDARFRAYWCAYKPLHSRPYVIDRGEVGLSTHLNSMGLASVVLYPAVRFINHLQELGADGLLKVLPLLPSGFFRHYVQKYGSCAALGSSEKVASLIVADIMCVQQVTNQSAFWQLVGLLSLGFPFVKKDIYARGVFSLTQIRHFEGLMENDSTDWGVLLRRISSAPDCRTFHGLKRLKRDYGLE